MSFVTLLIIALGVSADAFAVSLGKGLHMRRLTPRGVSALAIAFGGFQAVMPLLGWLLARSFRGYITAIDHWIAFGLLVLIGGKMLREAFSGGDDADDADDNGVIGLRELLVLSVATSVDALAVGISFAFLDVHIVSAIVLIGVITTALSALGVLIGHRAGGRLGRPAEIAGGVILIVIGTRILLEHLGVF